MNGAPSAFTGAYNTDMSAICQLHARRKRSLKVGKFEGLKGVKVEGVKVEGSTFNLQPLHLYTFRLDLVAQTMSFH